MFPKVPSPRGLRRGRWRRVDFVFLFWVLFCSWPCILPRLSPRALRGTENFVEADRTERNIAYLDIDSAKDNGSYITALTKIVIRTPEERAKFKGKSGIDVTGTDVKGFSSDAWRSIPPGSIGETMYQRVAEEAQKQL